jgi:hypothetical protein
MTQKSDGVICRFEMGFRLNWMVQEKEYKCGDGSSDFDNGGIVDVAPRIYMMVEAAWNESIYVREEASFVTVKRRMQIENKYTREDSVSIEQREFAFCYLPSNSFTTRIIACAVLDLS